jgi:hypothetical protein
MWSFGLTYSLISFSPVIPDILLSCKYTLCIYKVDNLIIQCLVSQVYSLINDNLSYFTYALLRPGMSIKNKSNFKLVRITKPLNWIFTVLTHWNKNPRVAMSFHTDTLFWFWANTSFLLLLIGVCLANEQQIPIL